MQEAQRVEQLADGALVRLDPEALLDDALETDAPPAHHAVGCPIRAGLHDLGKFRLLRGRDPTAIRVDQGSEFISRDLDLWAYQKGVELDFSRPGKPTDNAFIESFNGKFRAECLL